MNRRTLVQSILALPIFGWLNRPHAALATHAARTEGAIQGLKAHYGTQPQGLRARRQELVDTFLKTLDSAIQAEEQSGSPYDAGPESLYFNREISSPNKGRLTSSHKMKWSEPQKPGREPDELK